MSVGRKEAEVEIGRYPHASRVKKKGFTLLEVLVVGFILTVVMTALFLSLSTGEFSNSVGSAKADLQAKVRLILDWIVKDVRGTTLIEINTCRPLINAYCPSVNHIQFRKVTGIDNTTGQYTLNNNYIEYIYSSNTQQLTRNEMDGTGLILRSWIFNNITQLPFYVALGDPLDPGDILTNRKLVIVITGQSQVRNALTLNFSLTEEVKIRNE